MGANNQDVINGLQQAIQTESYGHHFYNMAAATIEDPKGKEIFGTLAQEELAHMKFLKDQYKSFVERGKADEAARLGPQSDLSGTSPIFSASIKNRISTAHFEMTALSVAINLELSSEQFYRKQSNAASDPAVVKFFSDLADWESGHYHALLRQQEELKQDYWTGAGFAPY
jgi:rubrerythrin